MSSAHIYQLPTQLIGTPGIYPNFKFMVTGDSEGAITTAGYLNQIDLQSNPVSTVDVLQVLYSFSPASGVGTYGTFTVSISNGVITLVSTNTSGAVVLPTVANYIAHFTDTAGTTSSNPDNVVNAGNIQAGISGTAGQMISFPATAAAGSLALKAVGSSGNYASAISNVSTGQATVWSLPDPANAIARIMVGATATPFISGNFPAASGTGGLFVDSGTNAASLMKVNVVNTMTGTGQIILVKANGTEATNAVTASGNAGVITTSSLTTAGAGSYAITWTNTLITATSVITLSSMGGSNTVQNYKLVVVPGTGTATLTIYNTTTATALNGTILIGYTVF